MATENKVYTLGLSKIEIGEIATDGGMGTTLEQLGYTLEDSCTFEQEDPEETEFNAEEVDDPVVVLSKPGKISFAFELMNPSVEVLAKLFGGTADTENRTWSSPAKMLPIERSVIITPTQGFIVKVPRMKLAAKIKGGYTKTGMTTIALSGTVLTPTKDGEAKITMAEQTAA